MDLSWTAEQHALHQRMRDFVTDRLAPATADLPDREPDGVFSQAAWDALAAEGVLGLPLPKEYGGLGHTPVSCAYAMEGIGYGCRDNGLLLSAGAHIWAVSVPVWQFGSCEQRSRLLPELASGQLIGAHALTEPEAGSDALALRTLARRDAGGYVLSGRKRFVTNGPVADIFLVYATIDPKLGFTGVTTFLVDRDLPGLRVTPDRPKSGFRTTPWAELVLEEVRVTDAHRLGREKQGRSVFKTAMAWERALILAPFLGAMQRQIEECLRYARQRRQFGQRIGSFQAVTHTIAEMQLRLESARLLTYRAAHDLANGTDSFFPELAKLHTSEAAVQTFMDALTLHGGHGYTVDAGIERDLRDALGTRISSGTSAIHRTLVAGKLGLAAGGMAGGADTR